jgi:hypothetical protein
MFNFEVPVPRNTLPLVSTLYLDMNNDATGTFRQRDAKQHHKLTVPVERWKQ